MTTTAEALLGVALMLSVAAIVYAASAWVALAKIRQRLTALQKEHEYQRDILNRRIQGLSQHIAAMTQTPRGLPMRPRAAGKA